ncbi:cyclin-d-binding myb-like transcription factor 1 [Anaeramoeba flamelloides]|uniref:Cyclin-d-binding myb-like transcription factor 1 n=1 Tax=Anaeramoeba flamelloides TaxID=1746091 RepID=A0ABQ8YR08_9EUKA|nr:cyclin-d-binding myb-like transcription factor 1 [Anaeramoeba flamelloides]
MKEFLQKLIHAKAKQKDDLFMCWKEIQKAVERRNMQSVYTHVRLCFWVPQVRGKWSKKEEKKLVKLQKKYEGNYYRIARIIGRHPANILQHWRLMKGIHLNEGWQPKEEERLLQAIKKVHNGEYPNGVIKWKKVAKILKTKNPQQCRDKWQSTLKDTITEKSHDKLIVEMVYSTDPIDTEDVNWGKVAEDLNQTSFQVRRRYKQLEKTIPNFQLMDFQEILDSLYSKYFENEK